MEAGKCAAGNGNKQDGEHHARSSGETGKHRSGDGCLTLSAQDKDAQHGTDNHDDHHDRSEIVARGLEHADGHSTGKDQVDHHNGEPLELIEVQRELHTHGEHENHQHHAGGELGHTGEVEFLLGIAKSDGNKGEEDGDGTCATGGIGLGEVDSSGSHAICTHDRGELEGTAHHVGESSDDDDAEQPAEQEEQATTGLADVLLDELGQRLAVVLHRGIQGAKVMYGTKEDAAHEHPQHNGQPAKSHGHDGARDRACAADRAELVRKCGECRDGREVLAVLHALGRSKGLPIDAPLIGQPASVPEIAAGENRRAHEHDYNSVHTILPSEVSPTLSISIKFDGPRLLSAARIWHGLTVYRQPALNNNYADNV